MDQLEEQAQIKLKETCKVIKCSKRHISEDELHKKKRTKSSSQKGILNSYFEKRPFVWERKEIMKLGKQLGLSEAQIYKWNWDKHQRNLKKMNKS